MNFWGGGSEDANRLFFGFCVGGLVGSIVLIREFENIFLKKISEEIKNIIYVSASLIAGFSTGALNTSSTDFLLLFVVWQSSITALFTISFVEFRTLLKKFLFLLYLIIIVTVFYIFR